MSTLWKKTGGVWAVKTDWSKFWKKTSGIWSTLYTRLKYIFTNGVENVGTWVIGYTLGGTGYMDKQATQMQLDSSGYANNMTVINLTPIDLTKYSKLYIDWQLYTYVDGYHAFDITTNDRPWDYGGIVAEVFGNTSLARRVNTLDVSSLIGNHFLSIRMGTGASSACMSEVIVYNIWAE